MICELCKLLYNPHKRELLRRVYAENGGINFAVMTDIMKSRGLVVSGVSQYLKQFERLGLIRRHRSGRYVNYFPDPANASADVRQVALEFGVLNEAQCDAYQAVFGALMNPFRARVIALLKKHRMLECHAISTATGHFPNRIGRELKPACEAGLLSVSDDSPSKAVYGLKQPSDPFVKLLVSFC